MSDGEDDFDKLLNKMEGKLSNKVSLKTKESEVAMLKKKQSEEYVPNIHVLRRTVHNLIARKLACTRVIIY